MRRKKKIERKIKKKEQKNFFFLDYRHFIHFHEYMIYLKKKTVYLEVHLEMYLLFFFHPDMRKKDEKVF